MATRRKFLCGLSGLAALTITTNNVHSQESSARPTGTWPMYRYDGANTGQAPNAGPLGELSVEWRFNPGEDFRPANSPVIWDGRAYFIATNEFSGETCVCYALSIDDGTELWSYEMVNAPLNASPVVTADDLYIADTVQNTENSQGVIALNKSDGSVKWSGYGDNWFDMNTYRDGMIYAPTRSPRSEPYSELLAIDAESGELEWRYTFNSDSAYITEPPIVGSETVFLTSADNDSDDRGIYCIDNSTGTEIWSKTMLPEDMYNISPTTLWNESVIATGATSTTVDIVYNVGIGSGEVNWMTDLSKDGIYEPGSLTISDDLGIAPTNWGFVGIDMNSGTIEWKTDIGGENNHTPVVSNGFVYAGMPPTRRSNEATIIVLDAQSGEEAGRYTPQSTDDWGGVIPAPSVSDGHLFVANHNEIIALSGEEVSQTPTRTPNTESIGNTGEAASQAGESTETEGQPTAEVSQQEGNMTTPRSGGGGERGLPVWTQFDVSESSPIWGGLVATLGLSGGYAAYRRLSSNDD